MAQGAPAGADHHQQHGSYDADALGEPAVRFVSEEQLKHEREYWAERCLYEVMNLESTIIHKVEALQAAADQRILQTVTRLSNVERLLEEEQGTRRATLSEIKMDLGMQRDLHLQLAEMRIDVETLKQKANGALQSSTSSSNQGCTLNETQLKCVRQETEMVKDLASSLKIGQRDQQSEITSLREKLQSTLQETNEQLARLCHEIEQEHAGRVDCAAECMSRLEKVEECIDGIHKSYIDLEETQDADLNLAADSGRMRFSRRPRGIGIIENFYIGDDEDRCDSARSSVRSSARTRLGGFQDGENAQAHSLVDDLASCIGAMDAELRVEMKARFDQLLGRIHAELDARSSSNEAHIGTVKATLSAKLDRACNDFNVRIQKLEHAPCMSKFTALEEEMRRQTLLVSRFCKTDEQSNELTEMLYVRSPSKSDDMDASQSTVFVEAYRDTQMPQENVIEGGVAATASLGDLPSARSTETVRPSRFCPSVPTHSGDTETSGWVSGKAFLSRLDKGWSAYSQNKHQSPNFRQHVLQGPTNHKIDSQLKMRSSASDDNSAVPLLPPNLEGALKVLANKVQQTLSTKQYSQEPPTMSTLSAESSSASLAKRDFHHSSSESTFESIPSYGMDPSMSQQLLSSSANMMLLSQTPRQACGVRCQPLFDGPRPQQLQTTGASKPVLPDVLWHSDSAQSKFSMERPCMDGIEHDSQASGTPIWMNTDQVTALAPMASPGASRCPSVHRTVNLSRTPPVSCSSTQKSVSVPVSVPVAVEVVPTTTASQVSCQPNQDSQGNPSGPTKLSSSQTRSISPVISCKSRLT